MKFIRLKNGETIGVAAIVTFVEIENGVELHLADGTKRFITGKREANIFTNSVEIIHLD
jgi:hypothetical protein